jgi:hypothetical protein
MTTVLAKPTPNIPVEFCELFGPPPLHKAEDEKIYNALLCSLAKDFGPLDTIGRILLRDLADYTYTIHWLRRLLSKLVREVHKQDLARRAEKLVADTQQRIEYAKVYRNLTDQKPNISAADKATAEAALKAQTEKIQTEAQQKLAELQRAEDGEVDEAALFRNWIPLYIAVQDQLSLVEGKFHTTVDLLDEHQQGLGHRLRKVAETIIDIEPENPSARD